MRKITRRSMMFASLAIPLVGGTARSAAAKVRFTLDWKYQGVHAWFYVARDKGYFADEGIDIVLDQGEGSAATIARIMSGTYDAGFGDINTVIAGASRKPGEAPILVYEMYNRGPYVLVTRADGPIRSLKDIEGRTLGAPAGSATARLMPVLARRNTIDMSRVTSQNVAANLQEQLLAKGALRPARRCLLRAVLRRGRIRAEYLAGRAARVRCRVEGLVPVYGSAVGRTGADIRRRA
ncbi:MAG: hypothetical protein GEU91_03830 [Rhizobiales bacterium]|nr:hypothetical protein [Hyphomicrobiales bacterium]